MALTKVVGGVIADSTITSTDILDTTITNAKMAVDPSNASNLSSGDVPLAQLDNVPPPNLSPALEDIALLAFKTQANGNLSRYNLVDQSVDAFEDAAGVDASASTGENRDISGKYYSGQGAATGGTVTAYGSYTVHTFLLADTGTNFVATVAGTADILVVGGGGSGGTNGGGGGAGGFRTAAATAVSAGSHAVTVGAGGAGGAYPFGGTSGGNSSFGSILTSSGGGFGGGTPLVGTAGGSGGGGGYNSTGGAGNSGSYTPVEGYPGSNSAPSGVNYGGGGGAGEAGGTTGGTLGYGGDGLENDYRTGSNVFYAGGGGGGRQASSAGTGLGGAGGGGAGTTGPEFDSGTGTSGTADTGGGGGGAGGGSASSGNGGSGIVVIRYTGNMGAVTNMTLESNTITAQAAPTKADLVFTYTNGAGTAVLGTNITAEASMDGGSTWTDFAIAAGDVQGTTGGHTIVTKNNVALTSTSGTNMRYRIKTLVQSIALNTRIHAVSLGWS